MEFETQFGTRTQVERSPLETGTRKRRMLVLADLSGRASRGVSEGSQSLLSRPLVPIDIDNFDNILEAFAPRLDTIEFRTLDDFHPDRLRSRLAIFAAFAESRSKLHDGSTFAEETQRLTVSQDDKEEPEDMSGTFERLLGKRPTAPAVDISRLIEQAVRPHIVPDRSPELNSMLESIAQAEAEQLRQILHGTEFQRLEAVWRSIAGMVNAAEEDGPSILLLDVSEEEIRNDLANNETLERSGLYRLLVENQSGAGEAPWNLLVGDLFFDAGVRDIACLEALGSLARQAHAPFIAAARPSLFGCSGFDRPRVDATEWSMDEGDAARWKQFRMSAAATWVGLAAPRILLRLPYGERTDPVDNDPPFEEVGDSWSHENYLWGNAAFACAAGVLAGGELDHADLPAHFRDGAMQPCAETLIGERAAEQMLSHGPMPFMSYKDRPAVRLLRLQSLADPSTSLPGVGS